MFEKYEKGYVEICFRVTVDLTDIKEVDKKRLEELTETDGEWSKEDKVYVDSLKCSVLKSAKNTLRKYATEEEFCGSEIQMFVENDSYDIFDF